jgi:hypothetical protein
MATKNKKPTFKKVSQFDGHSGKREVFEIENHGHIILGHSCLMPSFGITMRVGELRKAMHMLSDDDNITVTVNHHDHPVFSFVR